eukprot:COSAG04_NODE_4910_length_1829_cov_1.134682_1_plen_370_part_10
MRRFCEFSNGVLSRCRLTQTVAAISRKIGTTEHVSIDMDADGKISFAEFERWWAKHPELRESNVFAAATELESAWADIDTDGSGSLDADELRAVLETMGIALGEAGIAQLIEQLDTDGDGEISQAEFMAFWRKQSTAARARLTRSTAAEPEPEDAEGEEPPQPEQPTAAIGLVTVVPGSSKQKRHLLFCDTQQEMERWLDVLQEHQRFHHNYDRDALEWGEFLLGMGADVHAANKKGNTALHKAAMRGQLKTVKLLLDMGADAAKRNKKGDTALDVAQSGIWSGCAEVTALLLQRVNAQAPIYLPGDLVSVYSRSRDKWLDGVVLETAPLPEGKTEPLEGDIAVGYTEDQPWKWIDPSEAKPRDAEPSIC